MCTCKIQIKLPVPHGHHVCVPPEGHKHGVSIKSSINLGNTLLQIMHEWKTAETWFLVKLFIYQSSIISQILELIHWMVMIFSFDHMTGENREFPNYGKELVCRKWNGTSQSKIIFQLKYVDHLQRFWSEETKTDLSIGTPCKISGIFGIMESTPWVHTLRCGYNSVPKWSSSNLECPGQSPPVSPS